MKWVWLCLLPLLPLPGAEAAEGAEAPGRRSYVEATPEMLARRGRACRADLGEYQARPTSDLMDRLIACMDHPDTKLRAEVLDRLPDRRLWDWPDYEYAVRPRLKEVWNRFQTDPDSSVRLHAMQLDSWLANGDQWLSKSSSAARERSHARRASLSRGLPTWLIVVVLLFAMGVTIWSKIHYSRRRRR